MAALSPSEVLWCQMVQLGLVLILKITISDLTSGYNIIDRHSELSPLEISFSQDLILTPVKSNPKKSLAKSVKLDSNPNPHWTLSIPSYTSNLRVSNGPYKVVCPLKETKPIFFFSLKLHGNKNNETHTLSKGKLFILSSLPAGIHYLVDHRDVFIVSVGEIPMAPWNLQTSHKRMVEEKKYQRW